MQNSATIQWNNDVRLVLSDVDETIAEVYSPADSAMIIELESFLRDNGKLFIVTGASLARVQQDITDKIDTGLRHDILISHCSGAEVWGFTPIGELHDVPFYSLYDETLTSEMKKRWREIVNQLVREFGLRPHPAQSKDKFRDTVGNNPRDIMLDDRGPQITFEVVNGHNLSAEQRKLFSQTIPQTNGEYDLRLAIMERATQLLQEANIPITPRLGGVFALDLAIEGSSKTTSIQYVLSNPVALSAIGLEAGELSSPNHFEVWGDRYSTIHGGTDRHMSEALSPAVRSIDFREENMAELPLRYNIVIWDGRRHLQDGLLEYLQSRHAG